MMLHIFSPYFVHSSTDNTAQLQNPPNSVNYYIQTDPENLYSPTISQDPVRLANLHALAYNYYLIYFFHCMQVPAYPGQNLQFTLKALDAFDHPTSTITRISDAIAGVKSAAFSEASDKDIEQNIVSHALFCPCMVTLIQFFGLISYNVSFVSTNIFNCCMHNFYPN